MNPLVKAWLKAPISRKARNFIKEHRRQQVENAWKKETLIMTLLLKDEEHIVERNIRYHCAMGVDGVIVTLHNSSDRTEEILLKLKEEGLVLEIIHQTEPRYLQNVWVDSMVRLARRKYHATWVMNVDADEFYYSESLNLKKSIVQCAGKYANVLLIRPYMFFPDDREDFFSCPYFLTKNMPDFEQDVLGVRGNPHYFELISRGGTKVIHRTSGNPRVAMGNHSVSFRKTVIAAEPSEVIAYHYHIQNYAQYRAKVERYLNVPSGTGGHMLKMIKLYQEGRLREDYEAKYGKERLAALLEHGYVTKDPSVYLFMKYKGLI